MSIYDDLRALIQEWRSIKHGAIAGMGEENCATDLEAILARHESQAAKELRDVLARFPEQKPADAVLSGEESARFVAEMDQPFNPNPRLAAAVEYARALEKPADAGAGEPVAWLYRDGGRLKVSQTVPHEDGAFPVFGSGVAATPVAWKVSYYPDTRPYPFNIVFTPSAADASRKQGGYLTPLYASPPPATVANIPEGWVLVPKGTNWDMRNEAREYMISVGLNSGPLNLDKVAHAIWETMLAAAPKPGEGK